MGFGVIAIDSNTAGVTVNVVVADFAPEVAVITVDPVSGWAVGAMMEQSIGNPILDNSSVSAFRRWRFKPGTPGGFASRSLSC